MIKRPIHYTTPNYKINPITIQGFIMFIVFQSENSGTGISHDDHRHCEPQGLVHLLDQPGC